MPILDDFRSDLSLESAARALRLDRREGGMETARGLLAEAGPLLTPRAFYRMVFIDSKSPDGVTLEGRPFRSRVLRVNLEKAEKAFPFVLTVGGGLEAAAAQAGDPLRQYHLESLADLALEAAAVQMELRLRNRYGFSGLSRMSPGSLEDWPLTEQIPLFDLLGDVETEAGVRLTDSLLMLPRKSISGIFFPAEESFLSCRLCPRGVCPGRKAAYDPALWKEYQG